MATKKMAKYMLKLRPELHRRLKAVAKKNGRTMLWVMTRGIEEKVFELESSEI